MNWTGAGDAVHPVLRREDEAGRADPAGRTALALPRVASPVHHPILQRLFWPGFRRRRDRAGRPVGDRWRVDETSCRLDGRWASCDLAIDQDGQVVDVYFSERRNAAAAQAFFARASTTTGVTPERVVTDKALGYPHVLRTLLSDVEHRASKFLNNGLERDHGHLKQRLRPMRGFKQYASADGFSRGHALVQNVRNGCSSSTDRMPRPLRLATARPQPARAI
jgi:transposase-like protein